MAKFTATIIADHGGNYEAETYASNRFQAEDGIRDVERSRGLGDVYKRQDKI